jgi:hypothetical protein
MALKKMHREELGFIFVGLEKAVGVFRNIVYNSFSIETAFATRVGTLYKTINIGWVLKIRITSKRLTLMIVSGCFKSIECTLF